MITVHIPNNFIPERSYAVRTLLAHYCGVPVDVRPTADVEDYEIRWEDKSIIIKDYFFGKIGEENSYIDPANIPKDIVECKSPGLEGILMLYGQDWLDSDNGSKVCHVDLFAGAFFMLTRWEESMGLYKDLHDRFPASEALVVKEGFILRPIVDEYSFLLRNWLLAIGYSVPPDKSTYRVILSCDVDVPYYWRSKTLWKILGGRFRKHWNPIKTYRDYRTYVSIQSNSDQDPFDRFDYLMDLAEKADTRFQFNFMGGGNTKFEGYYRTGDSHIQALMQKIISKGHHIGMHPSYDVYMDSNRIKKEKAAIEESSGMPVTTSRQHYLRFAVPDTWRSLASVGILEDSTLGYAAEPGFRCGTSRSYPVFDIHQREQLSIMESPLLIMDVSFRMYKNLSIKQSIALSEKIKEQVRKHNGDLVVLWHNSSLSEIDGWEGWNKVLENLVTSATLSDR